MSCFVKRAACIAAVLGKLSCFFFFGLVVVKVVLDLGVFLGL